MILLALEKSVDGCVRLNDFAYNTHIYAAGYERNLSPSAVSRTLKRLRERGLVDFISEKELTVRLTDQGRDKALWEKIRNNQEAWDGKWRLVAFDIPEQKRAARDLLRGKLKFLGFTRWQKSLWASKVNCTHELRRFIRGVGIEDWVVVIESENIA